MTELDGIAPLDGSPGVTVEVRSDRRGHELRAAGDVVVARLSPWRRQRAEGASASGEIALRARRGRLVVSDAQDAELGVLGRPGLRNSAPGELFGREVRWRHLGLGSRRELEDADGGTMAEAWWQGVLSPTLSLRIGPSGVGEDPARTLLVMAGLALLEEAEARAAG